MAASWKKLEDFVRSIAALKFGRPCSAEHVNGVDVDGLIHLSADDKVLVEITENMTLGKVREDIVKAASVRAGYLNSGISCKAYVVMDGDPTPAMVEQGTASRVNVLSVKQFESEFFNYSAYVTLRRGQPFGSAVDSETGENDKREYVGVEFSEKQSSKKYHVKGVCDLLKKGGRVVAIGDYGTGKSRLVREVFQELSEDAREIGAYAVAINLRDHWGSGNFLEILGGHLKRIGLSGDIDNATRLLKSKSLILLLDGFDEIGAQSHDTSLVERGSLRRHALTGVRDLITSTGAGVLITGRSHYFDDDGEIISALGMGESTVILEVPPTFTRDQAKVYLKQLGLDIAPPHWLPMKPLVFQIAAELERSDLEKMLKEVTGTFQFWGLFIGAVTRRESKGVKGSISPDAIAGILYELGGISRNSKEFLGRFTPTDINEAYRIVLGSLPDAVGQQLLLRMCTLGRIEPESPDRQFLDPNIAEVVRAEHLVSRISHLDESITKSKWRTGLRAVGAAHAASAIATYDITQLCHTILNKFSTLANTVLIGEVISLLLIIEEHVDFKMTTLKHGYVPVLFLGANRVQNLELVSCEIGMMFVSVETATASKNVSIKDSLIEFVGGVTSVSGLPKWVTGTHVMTFDQDVSNTASIKASDIPDSQKLLLSIIHKLFFQPGKGREEGALLKGGFGRKYDHGTVETVLKKLMSEGLVEKFKGDDGDVYRPVRRHTPRMARMKSELGLSEDPIWKWAETLR